MWVLKYPGMHSSVRVLYSRSGLSGPGIIPLLFLILWFLNVADALPAPAAAAALIFNRGPG